MVAQERTLLALTRTCDIAHHAAGVVATLVGISGLLALALLLSRTEDRYLESRATTLSTRERPRASRFGRSWLLSPRSKAYATCLAKHNLPFSPRGWQPTLSLRSGRAERFENAEDH